MKNRKSKTLKRGDLVRLNPTFYMAPEARLWIGLVVERRVDSVTREKLLKVRWLNSTVTHSQYDLVYREDEIVLFGEAKC